MAKFLDNHATVPMPPEMAQAAIEELKTGKVDEFGVIGINAFVGERETWCLTEAPDAEAVCKHHEAIGVMLGTGEVTEIMTLV